MAYSPVPATRHPRRAWLSALIPFVLILTAHADEGVEREAREAGASGFLAKGTGLHDLVIVLHEAAEPDEA